MTSPLKGFIQSGILFIGDPAYMSHDNRAEDAPVDVYNPFSNWDMFTKGLADKDANLLMPGAYEDTQIGRGCAIQTGMINGQYTVEKVYADGKLAQIIIKVLP